MIDLLKKYMRPDGDRALLTQTGAPWVWREITATGERKSENVRSVFDKIKKRAGVAGPNKSVKVFRKTAASKINSNKDHRHLRHWFLGHAEETMSDLHYTPSTQGELDAAVDWLRTALGIGQLAGPTVESTTAATS